MSTSNAPQVQTKKVLIIASPSAVIDSLATMLVKVGYETTVVKNGADGLRAISEILPHLILLDIILPNADSYDIIARKLAEPLLAKIPIFLMSTQGAPIDMHRVPAGSVQEFIVTTHMQPEDIIHQVNSHFGTGVAPVPLPSAGNKEGKQILWVEDDKLIGTILSQKIVASGFRLIHAEHGEQALEAVKNIVPDGIVLDLLLPGMNGFEILEKIKADPRLNKVPVMILSNFSKPSDIERAKALGAQKFFVKAATSLDKIVSEIKALCG